MLREIVGGGEGEDMRLQACEIWIAKDLYRRLFYS